MKRLIFFCSLSAAYFALWAQPNEVEIKVTFKPFKKQYIYLGYHWGKQKPVVDSVILDDNSTGTFKRAKKLEKGIYLIGYPNKNGYFEILVDKEQKFAVSADTTELLGSMKFSGSPDNDLFLQYQQMIAKKGKQIQEAREKLTASRTSSDSAQWHAVIEKTGKEIQDFRNNLIAQYPDATITFLLKAMKQPEIPPAEQHHGGKYDSTFAYRYYKDHFWDGTYFYDERLARTSFFDEKLDEYFERLVYPDADSVIKELSWMLAYGGASDEMLRFLLIKFVNRYLQPKYMWDDRVFVWLFENYFSQKDYPWLNEKGKKTIFDRAYSMMANLYGAKASEIELPDSTGKTMSLYSVPDSFTVVIFWDPTCGHCKETLPRIDSIYRAKWKDLHVKIYAIGKETDGTRKAWLDFVSEKHLENWIHVYNTKEANETRVKNNIPSYYQLYDVQVVPTLYLLDKNKLILAKKIPFEQIDKVLDYKLKGR
jgi:thiol-disulfide isomerase/thioredoxin